MASHPLYFALLFAPALFFCHLSIISIFSWVTNIAFCISVVSDIILYQLRHMVLTIQEPETTEVVATNSPSPVSPQAPETPVSSITEWPQLGSFDGIEQGEVERTEWRNYELPGELDLVNDETPQELRTIIHESKRLVRGDPDDINYGIPEHGSTENLEAPASTQRPLSIASSAGVSETSQNSSQNESRQRSHSGSSSTLNIPAKLTNGQPAVRMGPLGWIITYPEGERPKKWRKAKEPREPKEDSVLKKFLKDKRAERATGSVVNPTLAIEG